MRLGTRGSALALAQAELVADLLGGVELITTAQLAAEGVADQGEKPAVEHGEEPRDKSRWVRHLERALLEGRIDLAVHSAKDLPGELPDGLELFGAPRRGPVEDVLVGGESADTLAHGACIGTSSLRRSAQLKAVREDLEIVPLSGNVDTRLRKLSEGEAGLDAIVLALAGIERLGVEQLGLRPVPRCVLDPARFPPSPGQGVLALEGRADDAGARRAAAGITDPDALTCLLAERALARALGATCNTPMGAYAVNRDAAHDPRASMRLRGWVGLPDGSAWVSDELTGEASDAEDLGEQVAERMLAAGAGRLLEEAEEMALGRA
jgi:hydroxymethylbilane synthase